MTEVRFLPPAAKYLKKLKDKRLKTLYKEAIDKLGGIFIPPLILVYPWYTTGLKLV